MTEADDALLWARERAIRDERKNGYPKMATEIEHGWLPDYLLRDAEAYRAGQSAAAGEVAALREENARLRHTAGDLVQHIDWLTKGLPALLDDAALTDEEGLIGAAVDAANSARAALGEQP